MKVVVTNRKAYKDFEIYEEFEAGIVLKGCEVKSLRNGAVALSDGYAQVKKGEVFLYNIHISPYKEGSFYNPDPRRPRKLLLKMHEINKLFGLTQQRGYTIVPLKIYFNDKGKAKVLIGLGRGRKAYDKKEKLLREEMRREIVKTRRLAR
ncbi:MAG: SsrA-binding protein SmpB [candidate division WOR-3 bacterium]